MYCKEFTPLESLDTLRQHSKCLEGYFIMGTPNTDLTTVGPNMLLSVQQGFAPLPSIYFPITASKLLPCEMIPEIAKYFRID